MTFHLITEQRTQPDHEGRYQKTEDEGGQENKKTSGTDLALQQRFVDQFTLVGRRRQRDGVLLTFLQ